MQLLSAILDTGLVFRAREVLRKPSVRVVLFSLVGVVTALTSSYLVPLLPRNLPIELASGAVDDLLHIVASSMLAVTTFSVSIMVSAFSRAAQSTTPRAVKLLVADGVAQNAIAVFVGSFLFSIVGIIGISAGYYEGRARIILFLTTLGMIALIVWALLRWLNQLNDFGRMSDVIERLEAAATRAAVGAAECPRGGALPADDTLRPRGIIVPAPRGGYLRHVDYGQLDRIAGRAGGNGTGGDGAGTDGKGGDGPDRAGAALVVEVANLAGHFVHRGDPLLYLSRPVDRKTQEALAAGFAIGDARSFDQDPRFGLIVLSEVASRALSPAVNDPGSAIDVLRAGTRVLLAHHRAERGEVDPPTRRHVRAPELDMAAAYREFFGPIARDGRTLVEVQQVLQDSLRALACNGGAALAVPVADAALDSALAEISDDADAARLRACHARVGDCG